MESASGCLLDIFSGQILFKLFNFVFGYRCPDALHTGSLIEFPETDFDAIRSESGQQL